jgi:MFS family permease
MIGIGFIVSTWVGYGSSKVPVTSSFSWRFPLGFQCIPCIIIVAGILFFPESPRHLMEKDKADEAMQVLRKLHYDGSNEDWIQAEFSEIKLTIEAEKAITAPGWLVMFQVKTWRTRLMHATLVQVFTQMTGCANPFRAFNIPTLTRILVSMSSDITQQFCTTTSVLLVTGTCL